MLTNLKLNTKIMGFIIIIILNILFSKSYTENVGL